MRAGTVRQIAFFRGINVGRAKRVAMADLRALAEDLGYRDARTLLNSGNLVFTATGASARGAASRIEGALVSRLGVSARVTVITAAELAVIVAENPLLDVARDPARMLVAVVREPKHRSLLEPLARRDWSPDALALGRRAAYLWCASGLLDSPLWEAVGRALGEGVTSRNWTTITKLEALAARD